jgi:hypothetical protein
VGQVSFSDFGIAARSFNPRLVGIGIEYELLSVTSYVDRSVAPRVPDDDERKLTREVNTMRYKIQHPQ